MTNGFLPLVGSRVLCAAALGQMRQARLYLCEYSGEIDVWYPNGSGERLFRADTGSNAQQYDPAQGQVVVPLYLWVPVNIMNAKKNRLFAMDEWSDPPRWIVNAVVGASSGALYNILGYRYYKKGSVSAAACLLAQQPGFQRLQGITDTGVPYWVYYHEGQIVTTPVDDDNNTENTVYVGVE